MTEHKWLKSTETIEFAVADHVARIGGTQGVQPERGVRQHID